MSIPEERYAELVDKKCGVGLTPAETQELAALDQQLTAAEAPTYAPVMAALTHLLRWGGLTQAREAPRTVPGSTHDEGRV